MEPLPESPFALRAAATGSRRAPVPVVVYRCLERVLGLSALARLYSGLPASGTAAGFCDLVLAALDVRARLVSGEINAVPARGPLIVVANHPFGGLDGLVLGSLLRRVRPDVRFLGNHVLARIPELREQMISVDVCAGSGDHRRNLPGLRAAIRWLKAGGALVMFPAGEVAHFHPRRWRVAESRWRGGVGMVARASGSSVLPVWLEGGNSALFYALGCVHPRLRTALLPRELLRQQHRAVEVHLGEPIAHGRLRRFASDDAVAAYLQARCELLAAANSGTGEKQAPSSHSGNRNRLVAGAAQGRRTAAGDVIAGALPRERLAEEIQALPADSLLVESGGLRVFVAVSSSIPSVVREIGRLRELTFREAGEGSGGSLDLDAFDRHYLHLFAWQDERRDVVGAYRLGPTDEILPRHGTAGLYTTTLFRYDDSLVEALGPAIELGRAFVRRENQRDYAPLMLLWKAIGRFVAARPRYRVLFGPVSISDDYDSISKRILVAFLESQRALPEVARLVRPRRPPRLEALAHWDQELLRALTSDESEVQAIVVELERHRRGIPVLLRQYLKLNARLLAFNVDPAFGNALDGLMVVDLLNVEPSILSRYMGPAEANAFRAWHGAVGQGRASGDDTGALAR